MIGDGSALAVITARGGSKGLPGKNLRPLGGRPLICWTVDAATAAAAIDHVVVSSDSEEILETAAGCGAIEPIRRPDDLAGDLAKQEDAVLHAMDVVASERGAFDYVAMLAPTNPLRDHAQIDAAAELLAVTPPARAVMTVVECAESPLHTGRLPDDGSLAGFVPEEVKRANRQELPVFHKVSGSVCIAEWDWFRAERSFMTDATYALTTSRRDGLDIDDEVDFLLAEALLSR